MGEFTVWFEEGPLATIALVIRGEPRPFLRSQLRTACEEVHDKYPLELRNAMVDEVSLTSYDSLLRGTLLQEPREPRGKQKRLGRIVIGVMAMALVILAVIGLDTFLRAHARDARFDRFISRVRNSEGVLMELRIMARMKMENILSPESFRHPLRLQFHRLKTLVLDAMKLM